MAFGYFFFALLPILVKSQILISNNLCTSVSTTNKDITNAALKKIYSEQSELVQTVQTLEEKVKTLEENQQNATCNCESRGSLIYDTTAPTSTIKLNIDPEVKKRLQNAGQFGTEFILSFPVVYTSVRDIQMTMVSIADGSVTLTSDISGVDRVIEISSKSGVSLSLPIGLLRSGSFVARNTVTIKSNTYIAVFVVLLGSGGTGDGYMAIPASSLKKKYFFSMNQNALLSIVSFSDETNINIESNAGSTINLQSSGLSNFNSYITLSRGQVLQIRHSSWVMGYVNGSKPFMFLHGSHGDSAYSRYKASFIDSVFYTDARFFIIPYLYNGTDTVTFCNTNGRLSANSDLSVSKSNNYLYIRGQKKVSYIRADFQTSCHYIGHGFSVSVPPVTSYTTYCRFLTPYGNNFTHHAAVIVKTMNNDGIKFQSISNNDDITSNHQETITVDGVSYSAIYYTVEQGQYEVFHTNTSIPIGVISYGFGKGMNTAYGFPVCFKKQ